MVTMEDVLAAHVATTHNISGNTDGGYQARRCQCGSEVTAHYSEMFDDADDLRLYLNAKFVAHVAEALQAAGFGNLHDAWAEGAGRPCSANEATADVAHGARTNARAASTAPARSSHPTPTRK